MPSYFTPTVLRLAGLLVAIALLAFAMLASVQYGVAYYSWDRVVTSFTAYTETNDHIIIRTARVPRALIAAAVGGSLAVAGALMQAITRNPLASPSLFGVNAGASFAIVLSVAFFDVSGLTTFTWIAFLGAAVSAGIVYMLGSFGRDGMTPIKITLAGSAIAAFFFSLTQGILLSSGKAFDQVLFWLVGSVSGRTMEMLEAVLPYMAIAFVGAMLLSPHMNVLTMGDDVAKGLGQRTILIKAAAALVIVLLAGGSVAVAGPILFIGVIIPHIVRFLVGVDYRWVLPYCAVLGALLLVAADVGARYIAMPTEVHVGVTTALMGVPFVVYIARKGGQLG
ncbi:iron ABC transporter permease [Paenibacillus sp. YYML68]|uniref:FecCD family ABC transporter permease n=1 Tax=Paenibacillus sp. YYML68 TaxID=2909250 RepID=UPI002491E18B|nr:iron ABC transporter permease [Paenibacillus sp. YYML68]